MVVPLNYNEIDTKRRQTVHNERNKKVIDEIQRGVIVNSIVKDSVNNNQNNLLRDYIIPVESRNPEELKPIQQKSSSAKPLMKLCIGSLGVLGAIAGITKIATHSAQKKFQQPKWDSLPDIGRNMNLNSESHFVTYMTVQNPQTKTLLGASAFFVFAATGFVLKNFADGFRDIWTKKQFAKADYQLQDNLIDVETSVFKGKNEIIRTMMQDTAKELHATIKDKDIEPQKPNFKGDTNTQSKDKKDDKTLVVIGVAATLFGAVALGFYSFKNIQKTAKIAEQSKLDMHKKVGEILDNASAETLEKNKETLINIFSVMDFKPKDVEETLKKAKVHEDKIKEIVDNVKERTRNFVNAPEAMGGRVGKIQYLTYIEDARGHFYNWIMNVDSKPLGALALAISGITAVGYAGEQAVNAVREVEVKKMNNETELNLHKNLVNVELRNFKKKKESYIKPLVQEFKRQAPEKNKDQLDLMAQNILYEIKNGPPFVYA